MDLSGYPIVTVVTVVLNDVNNIENTVRSVICQTITNVEFIVIDGGSIDGTLEVIDKYSKDIQIIISEPDNGLYDAMNKGTDLATGDWIIYMNSGDVFCDQDVLFRIFNDKKFDVSAYSIIYSDTILKFKDMSVRVRPRNIKWIWLRNLAVHQSVIVKTSLAKQKHFNLKYKVSADYDFICYAHSVGAKFKYIDDLCISVCDACVGVSKNANPFIVLWQASVISIEYANCFQVVLIVVINLIAYLYALIFVRLRRLVS